MTFEPGVEDAFRRAREALERAGIAHALVGALARAAWARVNHAEADGVRAGHRRERILTAQGSLTELRSQLKLAAAWGYVSRVQIERVDAHLDRVAAMTWRRLTPAAG